MRIDLLVMRIPYPRKRRCNGNANNKVREKTHDHDGVVVVFMINEDCGHSKNEPQKPGKGTSRVYTT